MTSALPEDSYADKGNFNLEQIALELSLPEGEASNIEIVLTELAVGIFELSESKCGNLLTYTKEKCDEGVSFDVRINRDIHSWLYPEDLCFECGRGADSVDEELAFLK